MDRGRAPARLAEGLLPEGLGDREVDVDPDQVHQLERAHPQPGAEPDDPVDLVVRRDPLAEHPQRLEEERADAAVGDEADRVAGADRGAAHPAGDLGGELEGRLAALVAGDDLDELHQRRRVEEVHADDPLGLGDPRRDRGHREGGGVGGEDGVGPADRGEPLEQVPLQVEVLGRGLDHQVAVPQDLDDRVGLDPLQRVDRLLLAPAAALGAARAGRRGAARAHARSALLSSS